MPRSRQFCYSPYKSYGSSAKSSRALPFWRFDGLLKNGWAWETYYQYGQNDQTQNNSNDFNTLYFQQSLQAEADPDNPGGYRCKDALARSLGCVPMDIFGEGSISQEAVDYVRATAINSQKIEQHVAAFSITGDAF